MDPRDAFRHDLTNAFPPVPFRGLVSTHDCCNDGLALRRELPRRRWDEVPKGFVDANSLGLPLLEPDALVAFLPAWLARAIDRLDEDNLVTEFTVYFLYFPADRGAEVVTLFDEAQRRVICAFLNRVSGSGAQERLHRNSENALAKWTASLTPIP